MCMVYRCGGEGEEELGCYYIYDRRKHTDCKRTVKLNVYEIVPEAEVKRMTRTDKAATQTWTHMKTNNKKT